MKRVPRPARGIRHTSNRKPLSTKALGRLAVLLVLALCVGAAAASLASRAQAQKKKAADVASAAEVLRPAPGPVRAVAEREVPAANPGASKTASAAPAESLTSKQPPVAQEQTLTSAEAGLQTQTVPVLTRQNAPNIPQCRELVRQDVLDIANAATEDPAETFERRRRAHPHMMMIPPTLDCASKFWQAARHGGHLPESAQDPDAITARQNPIETFFNLGALNAAIGTNVDPGSGVEGYQGENFISIDPNNPQHIVAHSNTFFKDPNPQCQSPTGGSANTFGTMALFGSTDGGATWTYNCAPWPAAVTGGVTGAAAWFGSDPALAWDNQGRAYATYMLISQNASGSAVGASVVVSRSSDSGASWQYLGTVVNGISNSVTFNDKEMMAIDNTSGQTFSHPGRIFVIWDANNVERIAYSDDGAAWTTVLLPSGTGAIGGNVVVGADGTVYAIWTRFNVETIVFSKSTDGGATWTAPSVIATLALQSFGANNKPPAQNVRGINGFGAIDIDRNPSSPYFGNLYVAFPDFPVGTNSGADINTYLVRSTDGGANWSSRLKVNDDNFGATQIFPWLAVDQTDGAVHVSWYDSRLDPINRKTQAVTARSINGGVSFEPNLLVTDGGTDWRNNVNYSDENSADNTTFNSNQYGDYMGIAAINRQVHPLWTDSRMFFPVADTHSPTRREDNASAAVTYCTAPTTINPPTVNPSTTPSVVVSWSAPAGWGTNATNGTYSVYRNTTNVFPGGSPLASGLTATSYIDTTGASGTTYFYFIRAKNNCPGTVLTPMTTDSNASAAVVFGDAGTPTGTLQGTVTAGGSPVVGAVVTAGTYSATTDGTGFYQIPGISAGTYTVATSPSGYNSASVNGVNVTGGATTVQNFALTPVTTASCFTDTTYNDFTTASSASGVEIVSSPGDVKLANTGVEGPDQVSSPAALAVGNTLSATTWSGQTFRAGITGNLTKISVGLGLNSGTTGTVTVEIRNLNGTNPGTTVLATGTVGPVTNVGTAALYTTTFATPAAVVSGTSYSVVLKGNTGSVFSVRGSTAGGSTLANGQFFTTTTSGTTWTGVAADMYFTTYVTPPTSYPSTGNLVSGAKDANAVSGLYPRWTTLSWTATTPANTSVQFQAAASNNANGPFNFVGPDGTAATFFTTSGASLSQFNGFRYLKYKAILNTSDTASTPTLSDVTVCFDTKLTQTINFDALGDKTYGDPDFQLNATSTSGLAVSYSASGNCTVTGDMVHLTGAGSCTITAMQAGNASYNAATNVIRSFNIAKAATTTTVTVNNADFDGNPHGATATVTGPAGLNQSLTVTYEGRNSTSYGPSTTAPTNAGDYKASASYAGDSNYVASSDSKDYTIAKAATTTGLISDINPSNTGQPVTFTATVGDSVASADAAGTVDFIDTSNANAVVCGGVSLTSGQAQCMTSALAAGLHNIQAVYSGNANFATSTSANLPQVVNPVLSVLDAKVAEPATGSAQMLFTVTLSAPAPPAGVTVSYATADDTSGAHPATAGTDYSQVTATTLTFQPGEMVKVVPISVLHDSDSGEPDETFLLQLSSPTGATIGRANATGTITQVNTPGTFIISELRTRGPAGNGDDFVELYNNTDSPLTINDPSGGYGVFQLGAGCTDTPVLVGTVPNGTVIPARGHYLLVGSAYSLGSYAAGDLSMVSDIEDDRNVALFSTANVAQLSSVNRLDAVGFGSNVNAAVVFNSKTPSLQKLRSRMSVLSSGNGVCDLMREGSTLPAVTGTTKEHSYFRKECDFVGGVGCTVAGNPKDTNDNASDFQYADTAPNNSGTQRLGAPGPEGLASPIRRDTSGIGLLLLDGTKPSQSAPNRDRDPNTGNPSFSTFGTLSIRRRVTNNTGSPVTRLRFRIVEITTYPSPGGGVADLRALTTPADITGVSVTGDAGTCGGPAPCTVTVKATQLEEAPNQPNGGGVNSTLALTLGSPLGAGQSVNVNFLLGVQQTGTFRFLIIVEALP